MQLYSLNSVCNEIENISNTKFTWCKTGCKLMRWQSVSNTGELIEFTQEIHLIVNIVKRAYTMLYPVKYIWICKLI